MMNQFMYGVCATLAIEFILIILLLVVFACSNDNERR